MKRLSIRITEPWFKKCIEVNFVRTTGSCSRLDTGWTNRKTRLPDAGHMSVRIPSKFWHQLLLSAGSVSSTRPEVTWNEHGCI